MGAPRSTFETSGAHVHKPSTVALEMVNKFHTEQRGDDLGKLRNAANQVLLGYFKSVNDPRQALELFARPIDIVGMNASGERDLLEQLQGHQAEALAAVIIDNSDPQMAFTTAFATNSATEETFRMIFNKTLRFDIARLLSEADDADAMADFVKGSILRIRANELDVVQKKLMLQPDPSPSAPTAAQ